MLTVIFFAFSSSFIDKEIIGTSIRIFGDSKLTKSFYQSTGSYQKYTEVIIDEGILSLEYEALYKSTSLLRVFLASSVSYIASNAFRFCYSIRKIDVAKNSTYFRNNDAGLLLSADSTQLVKAPLKGITKIEIPTTVTTLLDNCMFGCQISSIHIPWTVTSIMGGILVDSSATVITFAENSTITSFPTCFLGWSNIKSIRVPKSVLYLDKSFKSSRLQSVTFQEGSRLKNISNGAFSGTYITRLELPEGLISLNSKAIENVANLAYISIPSTVSYISLDAFEKTTKLETIVCSNNERFISPSNKALYNANKSVIYVLSVSVEELEIGPRMTNIGKTLLQGCSKLTSLNVKENKVYSSLNGVLYNKNQTVALAVVGGIKRVEFVSTCTMIDEYCCYSCSKLKFVSIPESISIISQYSFSKTRLESISLPSTIDKIGVFAFYECKQLTTFDYGGSNPNNISDSCFAFSAITKITVPSSVESLENSCFEGCTSLKEIKFALGSICKSFKYRSMKDCSLLETVELPSSLEWLENECFKYCRKLAISIDELENLKSTGTDSFYECNVTSIKFGGNFESIGSYSFFSNVFLVFVDLVNTKIKQFSSSVFDNCSSLRTVKFPIILEDLNPSVFVGCVSLTDADVSQCKNFIRYNNLIYKKNSKIMVFCPGGIEVARLVDGIEALGANSFYFCSKLLSIEFPNNSDVKEIPLKTFFQCTSLGSILIPPKVQKIMAGAFFSCTSLARVEFMEGSQIKLLDNSTFEGCVSLREIIFGEGQLTSVGSRTFYECRSLISIKFPSSLQVLGEEVFAGCSNLSSIEFGFPSKVQSFHSRLFLNCSSLRELKVPDSIKKIPSGVFDGCAKLSNITFVGNSLKDIEENAFNNLNVERINFDPKIVLNSIGNKAFAGTKIRNIIIPIAASIGNGIFENCNYLESINIAPFISLKKVPPRTFYGCKLLNLSLSELKVESIGDESFFKCESICFDSDPINLKAGRLSPSFCETLLSIGKGSFRMSRIGEKIVLGPNVRTLGESAFIDTGIQKVFYCGSKEVGIDGSLAVFSSGVIAYVNREYKGNFCGIGTHHVIDGDCAIPTTVFTAAISQRNISVHSMTSFMLFEGE